jgi:hypothetical protein
MRRIFTTGLVLAFAITALSTTTALADITPQERFNRVAYATMEGDPEHFSRDEVRLTVRAAAANILGWDSVPLAMSVAECESGFNEYAYNPGGPYVGVFQHLLSAWDERIATFTQPDGPLGVHPWAGWHNARAQAIMSMRMVKAVGWGPWACA